MSYQRGDVVWGPDPFKSGESPRPWLILNNDTHPFGGEEYMTVTLTTTPHDGTVPIETDRRVAAVDGDRHLDRSATYRRVIELGRRALANDLDPGSDARPEIVPEAIGSEPAPQLQRRHSYTSLDAVAECPRQHYLDYVLRAFDDPVLSGESGDTDSVSTQTQGIIFHEAAERAGKRGYTDPDEWKRAAAQIARARGEQVALPAVEACIDRFFELPASEWTILSAERDFELEINSEIIIGQVDALCRTPEGHPVVLDYKATDSKRNLETDLQLPLYVLACRELFDEPVQQAGYAYVGTAGPALEMRTFDDGTLDEAATRIREQLKVAATTSYEEFDQGSHCQWCRHAGLPCGPKNQPEVFAEEEWRLGD